MEAMFKVRKKGKTRGRPSKIEKIAEKVANYMWEKHHEKFERAYRDAAIYGVGQIEIPWEK